MTVQCRVISAQLKEPGYALRCGEVRASICFWGAWDGRHGCFIPGAWEKENNTPIHGFTRHENTLQVGEVDDTTGKGVET